MSRRVGNDQLLEEAVTLVALRHEAADIRVPEPPPNWRECGIDLRLPRDVTVRLRPGKDATSIVAFSRGGRLFSDLARGYDDAEDLYQVILAACRKAPDLMKEPPAVDAGGPGLL